VLHKLEEEQSNPCGFMQQQQSEEDSLSTQLLQGNQFARLENFSNAFDNYLTLQISLAHKQVCKALLAAEYEALYGGHVRKSLFIQSLMSSHKKEGKQRSTKRYYLPASNSSVNRVEVCRGTFVNVFGLNPNSRMLKASKSVLPTQRARGPKPGQSEQLQLLFKELLKKYPRTTGLL
jgi:hypothetical protein